ncbi:MAG: hypothetical protein COW03_04670 [Cytophagales bacterium CG12_big_fil_rev_8_21_14_0_65_40_12]|nr:MAG: hypothetical protein COW03_04670 [Cytophagales bacterium CG12_big_fil_rev_8_21_14_0_65_40_12]PIW04398.1 MAG: hypothetical protein COW40_09955 [Cytophagales bacterium CG17_big_fil_post_rev_8_21_14_2_50_40_13]
MQLQQISVDILNQLIAISKQLKDNEFSAPLEILSKNSIGKHIRHIVEFYDLMLIGHVSGNVDYDKRSHDRILEENRVLAIEKMNALAVEILAITNDQPITMFANYSIDGNDPVKIDTTLFRELQYNIEHAVHHMAIIKIALLNAFKEVAIPQGFGIAYSTIKYQKDSECAQ